MRLSRLVEPVTVNAETSQDYEYDRADCQLGFPVAGFLSVMKFLKLVHGRLVFLR